MAGGSGALVVVVVVVVGLVVVVRTVVVVVERLGGVGPAGGVTVGTGFVVLMQLKRVFDGPPGSHTTGIAAEAAEQPAAAKATARADKERDRICMGSTLPPQKPMWKHLFRQPNDAR